MLLVLVVYLLFFSGGGGAPPTKAPAPAHPTTTAAVTTGRHSPLNPAWRGNGKTVTLGFGGDVHFEGPIGADLAKDPSTALGPSVPQLFAGTQLRMVNMESVITDGACPEPQSKPYIFDAPASAVTALKSAGISLVSEGNDHGFDCGPQGLAQNLTIASQDAYPVIGIGATSTQAFTAYRVTIDGQRIAIIAATQMIAPNLVGTWTANLTQPGVASAIDPTQLVRTVQQVRRTADTVIVYVHWGTETETCPDPQQEPLATQLVRAGADIVIGSGAHVPQGAGYTGTAYVDYNLGNFAFYDYTAPETDSGSLILTAQGRHIAGAAWRPATLVSGLPQPLTGTAAATAVKSWNAARGCTGLTAGPSKTAATVRAETVPFVAPSTTTTAAPASTTTTTGGQAPAGTTTTATHGSTTTTAASHGATTSAPASTTTAATDNAGSG